MPVPQREIRRIKKEEAVALLGECTNIRDYFLLYLLFETGMRIGEALSLWLEDFDLDGLKVSVTDRGELENLAEIKTVHSPRKLDCTQELADLFMGYVCEVHTCDINTNHVFLKLRGENSGKPMDYTDVDNLFRTLRKKTGIQITPHVFRHTSLSLLYADGWAPELLRIRAGHKNIYTTINTYIHPTEEELTAAFNKAAPHLSRPDLGRKEGDA
jgi:integrase